MIPIAVATIALLDDEDAVECPECHAGFIVHDQRLGAALPLRHGTMYAAYCPECGNGVYVRGLADGDDE